MPTTDALIHAYTAVDRLLFSHSTVDGVYSHHVVVNALVSCIGPAVEFQPKHRFTRTATVFALLTDPERMAIVGSYTQEELRGIALKEVRADILQHCETFEEETLALAKQCVIPEEENASIASGLETAEAMLDAAMKEQYDVIRAARSQIMAINARMAELDGVKRRLALLASLKECRGASI